MLRIVFVSAALLPILCSCAVTDVKMTNAKGQTGKCRAFGAGIIGTVVALGMTQHCIDEYEKQGFQKVPAPNVVPNSPSTTSTDQKK